MPLYELGLVISQDLEPEERETLLGELKELLTAGAATITKEDVWGKRTLAYPIGHKREGFYVFWQFEGPGDVIKTLEYRLRLSEKVLRYLTLNLDRELRRKRKFDLHRKKKAARPVVEEAPAGTESAAAGEA
jgi:small subunit ribosomal protein S6